MSIQEMIATVVLMCTRNQSIASRQLLDPLVVHRHRQVIHDTAKLSRLGIDDSGPASHYIPSHCYYDQDLHTFVGVCGSGLISARVDFSYHQLVGTTTITCYGVIPWMHLSETNHGILS